MLEIKKFHRRKWYLHKQTCRNTINIHSWEIERRGYWIAYYVYLYRGLGERMHMWVNKSTRWSFLTAFMNVHGCLRPSICTRCRCPWMSHSRAGPRCCQISRMNLRSTGSSNGVENYKILYVYAGCFPSLCHYFRRLGRLLLGNFRTILFRIEI